MMNKYREMTEPSDSGWYMNTLKDYMRGIPGVEIEGNENLEVSSIAYDSRNVEGKSLFIAVRGYQQDGNVFIPAAIERGAVAVVTDAPGKYRGATLVRVPDARKAMAVIADHFYGSPQNQLIMTGITGTNGKTTTSYMVKSIFDAGGFSCGLIGTIRHIIGNELIKARNTTPEAPDIHRFLAGMLDNGRSACVMEVSSHALSLKRVHGINFRAAAYLNLSRDHLDFHGDFDHYLAAKGLLFANMSGDSTAVINRDDPYADYMLSLSRGARNLTFSMETVADIRPLSIKLGPKDSEIVIATPIGEVSCRLPIPGRFNVMNAMAAIGIGQASGISIEAIAEGLENVTAVQGRFEVIDVGQDFTAIIDYAHTPDALEHLLNTLREISGGNIIVVFGCGGDRDKGKRSEMGAVATKLADYAVITSDNPRSEEPEAIIADIVAGVAENASYRVFVDRKEAIVHALGEVRTGDTVVIAGKGHEDYQIIGSERIHFDDAETVREILKERG